MNKIIPQEDDTPHAEPASEREGESFGLWLRHQREGRGIELDEISKASKIGMAYLRAFEEERFEILPATVFAKGFLKQYALYVGMDPEEVVNFFLQSSQQAGVEDKSVSAGSRVRASARSNAGWLVLVGVLLLIVVFLVYSRSPGQGADPTEPSIPTERPMPLGSQSADVGLVVDATENDATENDATEDDETIIGETEAESPVVPFTVEEEIVPPSEPAFPLRVVLDFSEECWIEVRVDGKQKIAELKIQGESLLLEANEVVELKIGNINAVDLEVNETPYALEPKNGAVQNLRIDLASVQQRAEAFREE